MQTITKLHTLTLLTLMMIAITFSTGCVSYVNIPGDNRDTAINAVNLPPVPGIMARSIQFATIQYPIPTNGIYILPQTTEWRAYHMAGERTASSITAWDQTSEVDPAYTYQIISIRIRGTSADVDMILPTSINVYDNKQLLQLNLHGTLTGWNVINYKRAYITEPMRILAEKTQNQPLGYIASSNPPHTDNPTSEPITVTQPNTTEVIDDTHNTNTEDEYIQYNESPPNTQHSSGSITEVAEHRSESGNTTILKPIVPAKPGN